MTSMQALKVKRDQILEIATRHGVTQIRVFGSVARGEDHSDSDVDLLVQTGPETTSWFPGGLIVDLEKLLGRPVQVVTESGLDDLLRDRILAEAVPL